MNEEQLAEMMQRATDGRDHEWGWYGDDVPALVAEIRRLRAPQATLGELYRVRPRLRPPLIP